MSLALDLTRSEAKISRATEHLEALKREMATTYEKTGPFKIWFSPIDPQSGWCQVFLVPEPQKPRFGIVVGDLVHNLRSALDYIVTALVDATKGITLASCHQFPVFIDRGRFVEKVGDPGNASLGKGCIKGIGQGFGLIEQMQPYHRKSDPRLDPLWLVYRFSNADKHREIAELANVPGGKIDIRFNGIAVEVKEVNEVRNWTPKTHLLIREIRFDPPCAYNMRAVGPLNVGVSFYVPKWGAEPYCSVNFLTLSEMCEHVRMVVDAFKLL